MDRDPFTDTDHWLDRVADSLRRFPLPWWLLMSCCIVVLGIGLVEIGLAARATWGH